MTSEHYTKYECDNCGKRKKVPGWEGGLPKGWTSIYISRECNYEYCPECSKKIYLFALRPSRDDPEECWPILPADIEALAAGVSPEDIFV